MQQRWVSPVSLLFIVPALLFGGLYWSANQPREWQRPAPLIDAVSAFSVENGMVTLADGRSLRPAGVEPSVSGEQFDDALGIATAQGVVVTKDLGDGSAILMVEPKFYNWCGTGRMAGRYLPVDLSAVLVERGYAKLDPSYEFLNHDHAVLLRIVESDLFCDEIWQLNQESNAFPMGCNEYLLSDPEFREFLIDEYRNTNGSPRSSD